MRSRILLLACLSIMLPPGFMCDRCGKVYPTGKGLRIHQAACSRRSEGASVQPAPTESAPTAFSDTQLANAQYTSTRTMIAERCTRMRVFNHASGQVIDQAKHMLDALCKQINDGFEMRVARLREPASTLSSVMQPILEAIESVRSSHNETGALNLPLVAPVPRVLGKRTIKHKMPEGRIREEVVEDIMFDMPVERTLRTWFEGNPNARADVLDSMARWRKKADADAAAPLSEFVIGDASDAQGFKRHIAWKVAGESVVLMAVGYGDGATISNPIGVFRNNARVDFFYWALLNLAADHRTALCNIQLGSVCMNADLKRYGSALVLSGAAPEGSDKPSTSFGASVDRMSRGYSMQIPNPSAGKTVTNADGTTQFSEPYVRLFVTMWCCMLLADCPAAAELLCFKKAVGPTTICPCRLCLALQILFGNLRANPLRQPNSFLPWDSEGNCSDLNMTADLDMKRRGHYQVWDLRTSEQLESQRLVSDGLPASERPAYMQSVGVNSFDTGLRAAGFCVSSARIDQMHCEWSGNCQKHLLGFGMVLLHLWRSTTFEQLNLALMDHPWPRGCAPQPFSESSFAPNGKQACTG